MISLHYCYISNEHKIEFSLKISFFRVYLQFSFEENAIQNKGTKFGKLWF